MLKVNRRSVLKAAGSLGLAALTNVPLSTLNRTSWASGAGVVTTLIGVVQFFTEMSARDEGSGIAERFGALDVQIKGVLDNQILILEAIDQIEKSIQDLEDSIEGLFSLNRYRDRLLDSQKIQRQTRTFLEEIDDKGPSNLTEEYYKRYRSEYNRLNDLVDDFKNTLNERLDGDKGVAALLLATTTCYSIVVAMRIFVGLEKDAFPAEIDRADWQPWINYKASIEGIRQSVNALSVMRETLYNKYSYIVTSKRKTVDDSRWAPVYIDLFEDNEGWEITDKVTDKDGRSRYLVEKKELTHHGCFISPPFIQNDGTPVQILLRTKLAMSLLRMTVVDRTFWLTTDIRSDVFCCHPHDPRWELPDYWREGQQIPGFGHYHADSSSLIPPGGLDACYLDDGVEFKTPEPYYHELVNVRSALADHAPAQAFLASLYKVERILDELSSEVDILLGLVAELKP